MFFLFPLLLPIYLVFPFVSPHKNSAFISFSLWCCWFRSTRNWIFVFLIPIVSDSSLISKNKWFFVLRGEQLQYLAFAQIYTHAEFDEDWQREEKMERERESYSRGSERIKKRKRVSSYNSDLGVHLFDNVPEWMGSTLADDIARVHRTRVVCTLH